jgi:hypothetical protein
MKIRIIDLPPGEAPESIRRAWVGLVLPLAPGQNSPHEIAGVGVLTGPRGFIGRLWSLLSGRYQRTFAYPVLVRDALSILEASAPDAATWWRLHTPHLLGPGRTFAFAEAVCEQMVEN